MPTCLESVNSMAFFLGGSCKCSTASLCSTTELCLLPSAIMLPFWSIPNMADLTGYTFQIKAVFHLGMRLCLWAGSKLQSVLSLIYSGQMKRSFVFMDLHNQGIWLLLKQSHWRTVWMRKDVLEVTQTGTEYIWGNTLHCRFVFSISEEEKFKCLGSSVVP